MRYVSSDFYLFIYILAVFVIFLINLSINYYWYKTPKWLP
ncbi:putative membrane protein [Moraxella catarrhalis]|nr:putative membrane protein [Moraxella catarrhalis]